MKNLTLFAIGLAALALVLWLAWTTSRAAVCVGDGGGDAVVLEEAAAIETLEVPARPGGGEDEPRWSFHGLVRDGLTGKPIVGARALILRRGHVLQVTALDRLELAAESVSDAEGLFVLPMEWRFSPVAACYLLAEGYGLGWHPADPLFQAPESAAWIELLPAAELELRVTDGHGEPLPGIAVELSVRWNEDFGYPSRETSWRGGGEWDSTTDEQGRACFAGVPAETRMVLRVYGARDIARSEPIALGAGERRRIEMVLGRGARVPGTVRDQDGALVPDLELWLARPGAERRFQREEMLVAKAWSDDLGRFEFLDLPHESLVIGPAPDQGDFVPRMEPVVVDPAGGFDLVVTRGIAISGRIVGTELGNGPSVIAESTDRGDGARTVPGQDGTFRIAPLAPGEYLVHARGTGGETEVQRRPAGAGDVELSFARPRRISMRVLGGSGDCEFHVYDLERGKTRSSIQRRDVFQGEFSPGTYELQVWTTDLQVGFVPRLVIGDVEPLGEVAIQLGPSADVTLVHAAKSGVRALRLFANGAPLTLPPESESSRGGFLAGAAETLLVPVGELRAELLEGERIVASETVTLLPDEHRRILLEPR